MLRNKSYPKNLVALMLLLYFFSAAGFQESQSFELKRGSFSNGGGTAESETNSLLESAFGTFATGISTGEGYVLYGGMSITGKTQLFEDVPFESTAALFSLSFGERQKNYRIISIPAQLNNPNPKDVLEDDLGKYDKKKWRLFDCKDGKNANVEYPATRDFAPGVGLFLITKEKGISIDIEDGYWIGSETYSISLQKGWNLIGNPYNKEIPIDQVELQSTDPNDKLMLWEYNGTWKQDSTMRPWQGYAIAVEGDAQLHFSPFSQSGNLPKQKESDQGNNEDATVWQIQIAAQCGDVGDELNFLGVSEIAKSERDKLDQFEPPVIGDYISLYFPHPEWQTFLINYSNDYRSPESDGCTWKFVVESNLSDQATLKFSELEKVPDNFDIHLIDVASGIDLNLRQQDTYGFALNTTEIGRQFQLIVGTNDYINRKTERFNALPDQYRLYQNFPNPFNPTTTIIFELPQSDEVTLKIMNVLGQEVAVILNRQKFQAGRYAVVWDGRDKTGQQVGNGVYFYQIITHICQAIKKMIMMQ